MSFDEIFDLTAGVYFNFYNIYTLCFQYLSEFSCVAALSIFVYFEVIYNRTYRKYSRIFCSCVMLLRVGDAWLVGVGNLALHGFRCLWLISPHGSLHRLKIYALLVPVYLTLKLRQSKTRPRRAG